MKIMTKKIGLTVLVSMMCMYVMATPPCDKYGRFCRRGGVNTLFGNGCGGFGAFLGTSMKMTNFNGQDAMMLGGEFNLIFGRRINVGVVGHGLVTDVFSNTLNETGTPYYLELGYGGVNVEPVLFSRSVFHLTFPILLGGGALAESNYRYIDIMPSPNAYFSNDVYRSDFFFVAEPGINAEVNLFQFMRLAGGVSYRWVSDVQVPGLSVNSLEGMSANISLRFGWF